MNSTRRMPHLDSLRGIAILLVIAGHFGTILAENFRLFFFSRFLNTFGQIGVRLFFVLSGFLITSVLLSSKDLPKGQALRLFYVRRVLRIFPVYYLLLGILFVTNLDHFRSTGWWHVLYGTNLLVARYGWEPNQATSHFWSLAVEEQFYLIWPFLVLFFSRRKLEAVIVLTIFTSIIYRLAGDYFFDWDHTAVQVLLPGCLDALGLGALLALNGERYVRYVRSLFWISALLLGIVMFGRGFDRGTNLYKLLYEVCVAVCSAAFVYAAAEGFQGWFGRVMSNKGLQYVGVISYAIYLFHVPIYIAIHGHVAFTIVATLLLAALTRHFIELPMNNLKRYYEYPPPSAIQEANCLAQQTSL